MSVPALLDTSAWSRLGDGRLGGTAAERLLDAIASGSIALTEPLLLEILDATVDERAFKLRQQELHALPLLSLDGRAATRALAAQAELAATPGVSHRVKPIDLLVAAVADVHGVDVVHYDHDYDIVAQHTSLRFGSVWAAPRGTAG